jgi:hypothetical protein
VDSLEIVATILHPDCIESTVRWAGAVRRVA